MDSNELIIEYVYAEDENASSHLREVYRMLGVNEEALEDFMYKKKNHKKIPIKHNDTCPLKGSIGTSLDS